MRRESMSRPTGSVPSGNVAIPPSCQAGGTSTKSRNCSFGGWGDTTPASTASTISAVTTASPSKAPRLCEYDDQNSRHCVGSTAGGRLSIAGATSAMSDARIDDAIQGVDDQVDGDDDRRDQQDAALHDGIVARLHAMDQPVADTRPREDGLGQDRAGQQQPDLQ